jgi:C4-dicarboxylate transporter DctM subunit
MSLLTLFVLVVLIFALLEVPLFTVFAGLALGLLYLIDMDLTDMQTVLLEFNRLSSASILVALPLFTFTGCILTETKAPRRIMELMEAMFGWMPGGVAIAGLFACAVLTTLTGASGVTIVALGSVLYPILIEKGYGERFALGLLVTGGSLGLLFPPSLPIILYGVVTQTEIEKIFNAAFVPGIFLLLTLSLYAFFYDLRMRRSGQHKHAEMTFSFAELWRTTKAAAWEIPALVLIFGGVYGGYGSISEIAGLTALYVIIVECFILREVKFLGDMPKIMVDAGVLTGSIILILGFAMGFTGYLLDEGIPTLLLEKLKSISENKYVFLFALNIFLLGVGCVMDIFSAIVVIVPIMVPIALSVGVDPIHLCIIFLVNLEMGYATPPVGINLFIASLKFQRPITLLYMAAVPFLLILGIALLIITYVPQLSLLFQ